LLNNRLKRLLAEDKVTFGPFMKLSDPAVVEVYGHAGFDFVIIDMEHGPLCPEKAQDLVRAAELTGITPIIRVTANDPGQIARALDIGAQGVQVPHISSKAEAEKAVQAAKFAPQGERGVCRFVRAASYSASDRFMYFEKANRETMVIAMVEGLEGVHNIQEIISTPGIDVLFVGPYDLSQSLGLTGQTDHPAVEAKLKAVIAAAKQSGIAVGSFVDTVELAAEYRRLGIQYISYSVDVGLIYEWSVSLLQDLRNIAGRREEQKC